LKNDFTINRRDFLNGMAISLAAGTTLSPAELLAQPQGSSAPYYPPALTGMRGNHAGSFEVAHSLARGGKRFAIPKQQTEDVYDLVVVGGGISGLAAARFFREKHGNSARILILDNHDDFGGHAKRNELQVGDQTLLGYGGSQSLESPSSYSPVAAQLLRELAIDTDRFYEYFDQDFYKNQGLSEGIYYDKHTFGIDKLLPSPIGGNIGEGLNGQALADSIHNAPISEVARTAFLRLMRGGVDYLAGMTAEQKKTYLHQKSYHQFLAERADIPDEVLAILQDTLLQIFSSGWESISAYEALYWGMPGTYELGLLPEEEQEPYIFHFPDGNASIARALVRDLIPRAMPGNTMEDLVSARADYSQLDRRGQNIRLRLNSTVVNVTHSADERHVDVTYVSGGNSYRVRGRHTVLACYNNIIPHLCSELPEEQVEALEYAEKVPFVIGSFALKNWRAFKESGFYSFYSPGDVFFKQLELDFPVSIGDYKFSQNPDSPIAISAWYSPTVRGLPAREQYRAGRYKLLELSFADFEQDLQAHLNGMLGSYGFEFERDIAAITLNRWSHGYAYEFEEMGTPADWGRQKGPHIRGRARLGRISIANSDSEAYAYVDGAIDSAYRAVNEQI
jgi:spermidine dehydrogenase